MPIYLGVDPGLRNMGWGIVNAEGNILKYIASGTISPKSDLPLTKRLLILHNELEIVIDKYQPYEVAMEEVFVNKNSATSLKLGQARGAIILTIAQKELALYEYAARLVKKSIVGAGGAEKTQIYEMVKILLPQAKIKKFDEADALATAICHINHKVKLR